MHRWSLLPRAARALAIGSAALFIASLFSSGSARAASVVRLPNHVPTIVASSTKLGSLATSTKMRVVLSLPLHNSAGLTSFLAHIYNPKDPLYGQYLSPNQFIARYSSSKADYDAVTAFAQSKGLAVQTRDSRLLLGVSGTAGQIEAAFSLHLNNYQSKSGQKFYAPDVNPGLPADIASKVSGVLGLNNYAKLKPQFRIATPAQRAAAARNAARPLVPASADAQTAGFGYGHGHGGAYTPSDLNTGYDIAGLPVNGTGQAVAIYEQGGFFPEDVANYKAYYNLPDVPVRVHAVDGFSGAVDDLGVSEEAALDIDMILAISPGVARIVVYESQPDFPQGLIDSLDDMAQDNIAKQVSISYGEAEDISGLPAIQAEDTGLRRLAAQGTTVFASAGDNGAYTDGEVSAVSDPASQPYITGVGGTELYLAPDSTYYAEVTWNGLGIGDGATGGGVSSVWSIPDYQTGAAPDANGGSTSMRNVPDVALVADPITGVDVYSTAIGGWGQFGGTSVSSPLWAAYTALVNQTRSEAGLRPLGFANPALYTIGDSFLSFFDFHDILDGTNGNLAFYDTLGYSAGFGYDDVTGFGSFDGGELVEDLGAAPTSSAAPPAAPTYFGDTPGNNQVKLYWKKTKGAKGYYLFRFPNPQSGGFLAATTGTSFVDTSAQNGTLYEYYLEAVNSGGGTYATYPIYADPSAP